MMKKKLLFLSLVFAFGVAESVVAAGKPASASTKPAQVTQLRDEASPIEQDTKLVVFAYDPNLIFSIKTQDGMFTHIEVPDGEEIQGFYLSDMTRWKQVVSQDKARVFIKPGAPGLTNTATLVTTKRVYELSFVSGELGSSWYQRVRWQVEDAVPAAEATGTFRPPTARKPANEADDAGVDQRPRTARPASPGVDPTKLNFGYKIEGDGPFRPNSVFDDGKFTWIQLAGRQELPAMFEYTKSGEARVIDYVVQGDYLMVSRIVDGLELRLQKDVVRIIRTPKCGFFGC